jgi:hypothetical protein
MLKSGRVGLKALRFLTTGVEQIETVKATLFCDFLRDECGFVP